jgi:hypothetical protein
MGLFGSRVESLFNVLVLGGYDGIDERMKRVVYFRVLGQMGRESIQVYLI